MHRPLCPSHSSVFEHVDTTKYPRVAEIRDLSPGGLVGRILSVPDHSFSSRLRVQDTNASKKGKQDTIRQHCTNIPHPLEVERTDSKRNQNDRATEMLGKAHRKMPRNDFDEQG